jgi:hypothetical protein
VLAGIGALASKRATPAWVKRRTVADLDQQFGDAAGGESAELVEG